MGKVKPGMTGVWVGLKRCGCCVAVCVDDPDVPRKDIESSKREFLDGGLSVVYGTWDEWLTTYQPNFSRDCPHETCVREDGR